MMVYIIGWFIDNSTAACTPWTQTFSENFVPATVRICYLHRQKFWIFLYNAWKCAVLVDQMVMVMVWLQLLACFLFEDKLYFCTQSSLQNRCFELCRFWNCQKSKLFDQFWNRTGAIWFHVMVHWISSWRISYSPSSSRDLLFLKLIHLSI